MADFSTYAKTARCLGGRGMSELLLDRLLSFNNVLILQRSLLSSAPPNPHRMQFWISKMDEGDWDDIVRRAHRLDSESRREIISRALFFRNDFSNCYAVRSKTGSIAHIQWIVFPEENDVIGARYRRFFKPLDSNEIMIENAFTFPRFRGLGLFAYGTRHLLSVGRQLEYKKAITYVRCEKLASLNELIRLGFSIRQVVREYKVLGFTRRALEERRPDRHSREAGQLDRFPVASFGAESKPEAPADGKGEHQHGFR